MSAAYKWPKGFNNQRQGNRNAQGRASSNARQTRPQQQLGQSQTQQQEDSVPQLMTNLMQSQNQNQQQQQEDYVPQQQFRPSARERASSHGRQTRPQQQLGQSQTPQQESSVEQLMQLMFQSQKEQQLRMEQLTIEFMSLKKAQVPLSYSYSSSDSADAQADDQADAQEDAQADAQADDQASE